MSAMKELPEFTREEVSKHNHQDNCWVILDGQVLALPKKLLEEHPGGSDVILQKAGQDITNEYNEQAHSASAFFWARRHIVGTLTPDAAVEDQCSKSVLFTTGSRVQVSTWSLSALLTGSVKQLNKNSEGVLSSDTAMEYLSLSAAVVSAISAGVLAWRLASEVTAPSRKF